METEIELHSSKKLKQQEFVSNIGDALTGRRHFLRQASLVGAGMMLPVSATRIAAQVALLEPPDHMINIAEIDWEIAPKKKIRTSAYDGQIPGRVLRLTEGKPVTIDIVNHLDRPEIVHWHGQWIPSDVDGSMEEGTPMIAPGARTRIQFTPRPSGLHWYHTHSAANRDLKRGLYTGQFGVLHVDSSQHPGRYDQEQFLTLHDWNPSLVPSDDGAEEVQYESATINGRMLGQADPIQVKQGQRVLFHIVNASATLVHWLALPGHSFEIIALDGRPVPTQASVETFRLGPAERMTALVTMNKPGVWVLGEARAEYRRAGMGTVIEYAGQSGKPQWIDPKELDWDYRAFGDVTPVAHTPDVTIPLVFTSKFRGHGALNRWMINGKSFPDLDPIVLREGLRHRLIFDNRSMDNHPIHLHRHAFELVSIYNKPTSGVMKDVVLVKGGSRVEVDLVAKNPGNTLFHCHQQDHMDAGFMAMFRYA
jgi:FtsP/CotA-like multicopper oxidase with cupredoxin domain